MAIKITRIKGRVWGKGFKPLNRRQQQTVASRIRKTLKQMGVKASVKLKKVV